MSRYIVRIQLNHAKSADYTSLHAAMAEINFFRYIQGSQGNWYHLTTAMYYGASNKTASQLQSYLDTLIVKLYTVEKTPPTNHEILVVQESSIDWRLFQADKNASDLPPTGRYLIAKI